MNLTQLHYFIESANYLNFSKAAEKLFISQPALSRQIHALEHTLGVSLFHCTNRGLSLTKAGELLLAESDHIFQYEHALVQKLRNADGFDNSSMALAMTNDIFFEQIKEFTRFYNRVYDHQKFYLDHCTWNSLQSQLNRGTVDLVFCFEQLLSGIRNISSRILYTAPTTIVLPKSHPLASRDIVHLADVQQETFIIPGDVMPDVAGDTRAAFRYLGLPAPRMNREYPLWDTAFLECSMGNGVTIITKGLLPEAYQQDLSCIICPDLKSTNFVVAWNRIREVPHLFTVIERILGFPWFSGVDK